jgi:hypothetical protein
LSDRPHVEYLKGIFTDPDETIWTSELDEARKHSSDDLAQAARARANSMKAYEETAAHVCRREGREYVAEDLIGRSFAICAQREGATLWSTIGRGWSAEFQYCAGFAFWGDARQELEVVKITLSSRGCEDLRIIGLPNEQFSKASLDGIETTSEYWKRRRSEQGKAPASAARDRAARSEAEGLELADAARMVLAARQEAAPGGYLDDAIERLAQAVDRD